MATPNVYPTSVESILSQSGELTQIVQLGSAPSAANLTVRVLLDNPAALHVRVVDVAVYEVSIVEVPFDPLSGEVPDGFGDPLPVHATELTLLRRSDGATPIAVGLGNSVKISFVAQGLKPSLDQAGGALLITGDTWDPISVPLTFRHGSEVTTTFNPTNLTAQQGGVAITTATVRWVSGPAADLKYHLMPSVESYHVKLEPEEPSLRILPGETRTMTMAFRVDEDSPVERRVLRIIQKGDYWQEITLQLDVKPAPPPLPPPLSIEHAKEKIDAFYRSHGGILGRFGIPLDDVQRTGGIYLRRYAGGTIKLLDNGPRGSDITWVRVRFVGFFCVSESSEWSASDEPYFLLGVAGTNNSNTVLFGPYENVDGGESRFEATDIASATHMITPPVVLGVIAMEHDEGTPEEAESKVRDVIESIQGKIAQAAGAFGGAEAGSHVMPEWARDILIGWVPEAVAAILGLGDDEVGRAPLVLFDNKADLLEWRSPPVKGLFGQNEYTHVIRVGEDDGPEGQYDLHFKIDLFRSTTEIIGL